MYSISAATAPCIGSAQPPPLAIAQAHEEGRLMPHARPILPGSPSLKKKAEGNPVTAQGQPVNHRGDMPRHEVGDHQAGRHHLQSEEIEPLMRETMENLPSKGHRGLPLSKDSAPAPYTHKWELESTSCCFTTHTWLGATGNTTQWGQSCIL